MYRMKSLPTAQLGLVVLLVCGSVLVDSSLAHAQAPRIWASATTPVHIDLSDGPTISVELRKWRKRHVLVVDAVVRPANATSGGVVATPSVNGLALDPSPSVNYSGCNGFCYVSARWILDLDQANVDYPGFFTSNGTAGLPLTIQLQGLTSESVIGSLLLTAKLEKKR